MTQTSLPFDTISLARSTDPLESHQAAHEITVDGSRGRMVQVAIDAVTKNPGMTANELEQMNGYRDGQLRKRLTEAEEIGAVRRGPVRTSGVTGKQNVTWFPSSPRPELASAHGAQRGIDLTT